MKVAVVGATGAVGQKLLSILEERKFPVTELVPFASARSLGKEVLFNGKRWSCRALERGCFAGVEMAFFDASDAVSKEWVPPASEAGAWVVDNSASFRMDADSLLLVPEVNGTLLDERLRKGKLSARERILTGPNCSTVQLVMALKPISDRWGLERIVVSTYQSTSGAGAAASEELLTQTRDVLDGKPVTSKIFQHPIAFNCIPHIGGFSLGSDTESEGYTSEERKIVAESRKILGLPSLRVSATAIRVPTVSCHAESVNVQTMRAFELEQVRAALAGHAGVIVDDDPARSKYPMGRLSTGGDFVHVGRIRRDPSQENGLNLWVVSDNLRKGAALNAVQIGEAVLRFSTRS